MSFTYLEELERLRDLLWDSLEDAPADKRGTLAREYRATVEKNSGTFRQRRGE